MAHLARRDAAATVSFLTRYLSQKTLLEKLNRVLEARRTVVQAECGGDHGEIPVIKPDEDSDVLVSAGRRNVSYKPGGGTVFPL